MVFNWKVGVCVIFCMFGMVMAFSLSAKTLEMEQEDSADALPISTGVQENQAATDESGSQEELLKTSQEPRVRISDNIGFYYFVSAGYVMTDTGKIPALGTVIGSLPDRLMYSTPEKVYVQLSNAIVKPGDFLVVYRTNHDIQDENAGHVGRQVENLAILQVIEVQKERCLTEVKEGFLPFGDGDFVKSYNDEIVRWKQAQRRKVLPTLSIHCFVVGGHLEQENYSQNDFVILSAGQKDGVVEGQVFKLRKRNSAGVLQEDTHQPLGEAQVFYVGAQYSMAQILNDEEPIQKGFEAWY